MTDNIFGDQPTAAPAAPTAEPTQQPQPASVANTPVQDPYTELLSGIKTTEGNAKYGTVSDALNSIPAAQSHIEKLELENSQLREANDQSNAVDTILERLNQQQVVDQPQTGMDENTVLALISSALENSEQQKTDNQNTQAVVTAMTEKFGDKAEEALYGKAAELGISNEFMNQLAAKSPRAVLEMFKTTESGMHKTAEGINTSGMQEPPKEINTKIMGGATQEQVLDLWNACAPSD